MSRVSQTAGLGQLAKIGAFLALIATPIGVQAVECRPHSKGFKGWACFVDPSREPLELRLKGSDGAPLESFAALKQMAAAEHKSVVFAMNAGMFERDRSPVGLLIQDGLETAPLNQKAAGVGNFYLQPNGVFYLSDQRAAVVSTDAYRKLKPQHVTIATQSGPMLLVSGSIPAVLHRGSTNRAIRNGIGVTSSGRVAFAISTDPVSFYDFATFFRDVLKCRDALYLDGFVSSLSIEEITIGGEGIGPMFVVLGRGKVRESAADSR